MQKVGHGTTKRKATEREGRFAALLFFVSRETSICFNAKSGTKRGGAISLVKPNY